MTDGIVTLKERHRRRMEGMAEAIAAIDAALAAYARQHGGRFGSTAEGRMRHHSDVDIIADFAGEASIAAADFAQGTCFAHGMVPDAHAGAYLSPAFKAEAERRGLVIA